MIRFLASVATPEEALVALAGGADVIDLKEPSDGALGAVSPDVIERTIAAVGGRRPVSAVAGNLPMRPESVRRAIEERLSADFVKIGLFPAGREETEAVIAAARDYSERSLLIAVMFADGAPDLGLVTLLRDAGFSGVMLDTMDKGSGGLLRHMSLAKLHEFVGAARDANLMTGLAGSLEAPDIQRLGVLGPDFLGFRSALTRNARDSEIDEAKVAEIAGLIAGLGRPASPVPSHANAKLSDADLPGAAAPGAGATEGDTIFVRDFVLPLEIGAYAHEYGRRQDVRFSVDATIDPIPSDARTMGDIYSYDVIIDAIRALAESGHTVLVEELASRLAETVLADRRVRRVRVKVEKLDLGPGAVGVEIVRPAPHRESRSRRK
ncbi:hypothetical protein DYI37_06275 [Fulvimarina endophytica]|uniref:4-(hydroxymethyl)-2-furancarboxaldehyde-phosphate synthase n=1 Tax=Fulvimarina endophytica TaxID=2293836 RepID=A0A371X869_9HYPH|nr:(5-formylfuran-3-yl)methyl phosphate synthase [Fulvimarina endophytica]RFC65422.1 hypothetical protein DYI37_06275 [Fulvimarina endophytica]